jgi:hypothetical protein
MAFPSTLVRTKNWTTEVLTDSDLEGQFDLGFTWINSAMDASTGHDHSAGTSKGPKITLTAGAGVTGTLPVTNGGTGQATLAAFLNLIYPVGSIYSNKTVATNPGTLLGFGTWTALEGVVVVGYKSGDANFGTPGASVGAATVTLTTAEMPAHTHPGNYTKAGSSGTSVGALQDSGSTNTGTAASAVLTEGDGDAHANIQPSVVCYVWERVS